MKEVRQPYCSNDRAALHGGDSHRKAASPGNQGSVRRAQDQSSSPWGPSENGKLLLLVWLCSSVQEQSKKQGWCRGMGNNASLCIALHLAKSLAKAMQSHQAICMPCRYQWLCFCKSFVLLLDFPGSAHVRKPAGMLQILPLYICLVCKV